MIRNAVRPVGIAAHQGGGGAAAAFPVSRQLVVAAEASAAVSSDAAASADAAPDAAPAPGSSEDLMRLVYANNSHPTLHRDLWGEIATFASRSDVLRLRSTGKDMAKWVDRALTRIEVDAENAPAMLRALGKAANLKHINTLEITACHDGNLPPLIASLGELPHARLHIAIRRDSWSWDTFTEAGLVHLREIAPASLRLSDIGPISVGIAEIIAGLNYPVHLFAARDGSVPPNVLQILARTPRLASLVIKADGMSDDVAQRLGTHPTLCELRIVSLWPVSITDHALAALVSSSTLKTLDFCTTEDFGPTAMAALALNRHLEKFCLGGIYHAFDESLAGALSRNNTLREVEIQLKDGCGHLAKMTSLEHLTITGVITLDDAHQFAAHAQLKTLCIHRTAISAGALAVIVSCRVAHLKLEDDVTENLLNDEDVDALLKNKSLRSLAIHLCFDEIRSVGHAIRLAAHPTLRDLTIRYKRPDGVEEGETIPIFTGAEWLALTSAWGRNRSASALDVDYG
jgi:hypothetical protein